MKNWLIPRLFLTMLFSILMIGMAQIIGKSQPLSAGMETLHLNDCELPCWIGIKPGTTTIDEARQMVLKAYPNLIFREDAMGCDGVSMMELGNSTFTLNVEFNFRACSGSDTVESITLVEPGNTGDKAVLGDFYGILGRPDELIMSGSNSDMIFPVIQYSKYHIWVYTTNGIDSRFSYPSCKPLSANLPFAELKIWYTLPTENGNAQSAQEWKGFQSCHILFEDRYYWPPSMFPTLEP